MKDVCIRTHTRTIRAWYHMITVYEFVVLICSQNVCELLNFKRQCVTCLLLMHAIVYIFQLVVKATRTDIF